MIRPSPNPGTLVVLGGSVTALAVTRHAWRKGWRVWIINDQDGPALATRRAARAVLCRQDDRDRVAAVQEAAGDRADRCLIATSDRWLAFVARHREELEAAFGTILHASNEVLETCLDKAAFSRFCGDHGIETPQGWTGKELEERIGAGEFRPPPLIVRPAVSAPAADTSLPKASQVNGLEELRVLQSAFAQAGVAWVATRSLLDRPLSQYSVGFARKGSDCLALSMEKVRPDAVACQVGSCVRLTESPQAVAVARRLIDALDYQGVGEVEILHDRDSGEFFVIELNARPWLQFGLATAAGWDFLGFALGEFETGHAGRITGKTWIDLWEDLYVCFNRRDGMVRRGRLRPGNYARSWASRFLLSHWSWADPGPGWAGTRKFWARRRPA